MRTADETGTAASGNHALLCDLDPCREVVNDRIQ